MNPRIKKVRVKRWREPKPVPPPRPPRPKRSSLKHMYNELISTDRDQRLEALKKAMHWYEGLQAYLVFHSEFTLHQKKAKSEAEKHRLKGLNSDKSETKELHYIAAIKSYESMGRRYHVPKLGTYLSKYTHVRSKLLKRKNRFVHKFGEFLELLGTVLRPKNYDDKRIELRVDKLTSKYRVDSEGNITFDRKFLDFARRVTRTDGMLPGLLDILPVLTEAAATRMETDSHGHRTGRYVISGTKRHAALLLMLENLTDYCLHHDRPRIIRRHKEKVHAKIAA
jgi:hypothetical protein